MIKPSLQVPFQEPIINPMKSLTRSWEMFFRDLRDIVAPISKEQSATLLNNQSTAVDIDGMFFNKKFIAQVVVDYLIQRITTGASGVTLVESGFFILAAKPPNEWTINVVDFDNPDNSGVTFKLKQEAVFTATYAHGTGNWTRTAHGLPNGTAVTLTAGTALPTGYSANTTYYVINTAANTFQLSATKGGAAVTAATDSGTGTLTVFTSNGQVQYTSSNIGGTAFISRIFWRARTMGGKSSTFSQVGER